MFTPPGIGTFMLPPPGNGTLMPPGGKGILNIFCPSAGAGGTGTSKVPGYKGVNIRGYKGRDEGKDDYYGIRVDECPGIRGDAEGIHTCGTKELILLRAKGGRYANDIRRQIKHAVLDVL